MKSYEKKIISNRKIILWGASMYGEIAYKVLTEIYDVPVFSIIDNRYRKDPQHRAESQGTGAGKR